MARYTVYSNTVIIEGQLHKAFPRETFKYGANKDQEGQKCVVIVKFWEGGGMYEPREQHIAVEFFGKQVDELYAAKLTAGQQISMVAKLTGRMYVNKENKDANFTSVKFVKFDVSAFRADQDYTPSRKQSQTEAQQAAAQTVAQPQTSLALDVSSEFDDDDLPF